MNNRARVAVVLASMAAAILQYYLLEIFPAPFKARSFGEALTASGQGLLSGWAAILMLAALWIVLLQNTHTFVVRLWSPARLWKSAVIVAVWSVLMVEVLAFLGGMATGRVDGAVKVFGRAAINGMLWKSLGLLALAPAAVGVTVHAFFLRVLKADRRQ